MFTYICVESGKSPVFPLHNPITQTENTERLLKNTKILPLFNAPKIAG